MAGGEAARSHVGLVVEFLHRLRTRLRVASLISLVPRKALDTVMTDTFKSRAMSLRRIAIGAR